MMSSISAQRKPKKTKVVKASVPKSKTTGRSSGHPNYQTDKLLDIIEAVKPLGSENWKAVAKQYKIISGEELERDHNDLKIKFKKLHNLGAGKPTGTPTMIASQTRARRIFKEILQKEGCSTTCNESDNDAESQEEDGEYIEDDFAGEEEFSHSSEVNNSFDGRPPTGKGGRGGLRILSKYTNAGRVKPVIVRNDPSSPKFSKRSQGARRGCKIALRVKIGLLSLILL